MEGTSLDVMLTGELSAPHVYVFRPRGRRLFAVRGLVRPEGPPVRMACVAYAVRHPSAGTILVDTGFHADAATDLRGDFGLLMSQVFRGLKPAERPFGEQLGELGIDPSEVRTVVMTHLHVDHTSGMRLLPEAEFVCARAEWKAATGAGASTKGYAAGHLPAESRVRPVDFDREGEPHGPFARTVDLLGDGTIRLVSTPGHTAGHLSVLVQLDGGRETLLVGDAAYTLRNIREERLPLLTANDSAYLASLREIRAFAEASPDAILVPSHDPDAWRALSHVVA